MNTRLNYFPLISFTETWLRDINYFFFAFFLAAFFFVAMVFMPP
jgi:hypothetical protein